MALCEIVPVVDICNVKCLCRYYVPFHRVRPRYDHTCIDVVNMVAPKVGSYLAFDINDY
jgi:hypothetical protein